MHCTARKGANPLPVPHSTHLHGLVEPTITRVELGAAAVDHLVRHVRLVAIAGCVHRGRGTAKATRIEVHAEWLVETEHHQRRLDQFEITLIPFVPLQRLAIHSPAGTWLGREQTDGRGLGGQTGCIAKHVEYLRGDLALRELAAIVGLQDDTVHLIATNDDHMTILIAVRRQLAAWQILRVALDAGTTTRAEQAIILGHAQRLILLARRGTLQWQLAAVQHLLVRDNAVEQAGGKMCHVVHGTEAAGREHHAGIRVDRQRDAHVHVHVVQPVVVGLKSGEAGERESNTKCESTNSISADKCTEQVRRSALGAALPNGRHL